MPTPPAGPPEPPGPVATPTTPAAPALPGAGDLVAGRYQLEALASGPGGAAPPPGDPVLWRARDTMLARPVAVALVTAAGRDAATRAGAFLAAAASPGALTHPSIAQVYDAAIEPRRAGRSRADVAYVVREWVEGPTLLELVRDGALPVADAVQLGRQLAAGLAALRDHGLQDLLPAGPAPTTVRVAAGGRAVLVLPLVRDPATPLPGPPTAGVGRCLRTMLGPDPETALQVAPPALRTILTRLAADPGPLADPTTLAAALDDVARDLQPPVPLVPRSVRPGPPPWWRRALPWVASVAFVAVVAASTYQLGKEIGELPRQAGAEADGIIAPTPSSSPGAAAAVRIPLDAAGVRVDDFDPQGSDGAERPAEVVNAYDGDVTTAWLTSRYRSRTFGGIKTGVGLLVDLGAVTSVSRVDVALTTPGTDLEVYVADPLATARPADVTQLRRVAGRSDASGVVRLATGESGTVPRTRFVVVWITGLPQEAGGFRAGINELVLVR